MGPRMHPPHPTRTIERKNPRDGYFHSSHPEDFCL